MIKEIELTEEPVNQSIEEKFEVIRLKINELIKKANNE